MEIIDKYFSDFTPKQKEQLNALLPLYKEWNEKINVISRKDIDNFYLHHVLHSLTITTQFEFEKGASIMDLGCGGGFPGVPLAIFFPETEFYMVDSINKKLNVVKEIAARDSKGWDGNYRGTPLSSDDYWFMVYLEDGRILKGHFALKR